MEEGKTQPQRRRDAASMRFETRNSCTVLVASGLRLVSITARSRDVAGGSVV